MNSSSKKPSYAGKDVFIGIDVHKRTYSVAVVVEGRLVKKWQTSAVPEQLARQLNSYFPEANLHSAYEAGFSGFVLHRKLEEAGIENLVVDAASIETTVHNRVKTDKQDALKLASLLEAGRFKGIRIPTEEEEAHRLLTRTRFLSLSLLTTHHDCKSIGVVTEIAVHCKVLKGIWDKL